MGWATGSWIILCWLDGKNKLMIWILRLGMFEHHAELAWHGSERSAKLTFCLIQISKQQPNSHARRNQSAKLTIRQIQVSKQQLNTNAKSKQSAKLTICQIQLRISDNQTVSEADISELQLQISNNKTTNMQHY